MYVEIIEGVKPINTILLATQNSKVGTVYKLFDVEMPDYTEKYIEIFEANVNYAFKANIRQILEIFGVEVTERYYTKEQIEAYLKNEQEKI